MIIVMQLVNVEQLVNIGPNVFFKISTLKFGRRKNGRNAHFTCMMCNLISITDVSDDLSIEFCRDKTNRDRKMKIEEKQIKEIILFELTQNVLMVLQRVKTMLHLAYYKN